MRAGQQVKRLFDLEIDEVSLVDRPANQFGKVAFSKRAEDEMPELYDLDGEPVDESELEHGETVTDGEGNEFVFLEEGSEEYEDLLDEADDYDDADDYDGELVGVGKASKSTIGFTGVRRMRGAKLTERAEDRAHRAGTRAGRAVGSRVGQAGGSAYRRARLGPAQARYRGSRVGSAHMAAGERVYQAGRRSAGTKRNPTSRGRKIVGGAQDLASAGLFHSYAHPAAYAAGGTAAVAAGAEGARRRRRGVKKSFGGEIYEELSKALTQSDRDEAIAKALDVVDELAEQNEELYDIVGKMADEAALEDFSKLAEEYGPLPVHPGRLGAIMKRAADTLPEADVEILDRLFSSVGEQLYDEFGKSGTGDSLGVMDQVSALADEVVYKSDMTPEQAITAIFAENPDAYDEYLAESATR